MAETKNLRLKKCTIAVPVRGEKKPRAVKAKACRGLAIHRTQVDDGDGYGWTVAHVGSGRKVGPGFLDEATARAVLKALLEIEGADWTVSHEELAPNRALGKKASTVAYEIAGAAS